jgi:hypothetical protein
MIALPESMLLRYFYRIGIVARIREKERKVKEKGSHFDNMKNG